MATTFEVMLAGLALILNTIVLLVMYFVGNTILGPVYDFAGSYFAENPPIIPMTEISYMPSAIVGLLLILEVVFIISFAMVLGRRQTTGDWYE
jgi:drug/metabolite transporter (DMT)-like permease